MRFYETGAKRVLDVVISVCALLLLSPLLLLTAIAILIEDGAPVLFRQVRSGRAGEPFTIFKFRSMPATTPSVPSSQAGGLRVTRVGAIIRRLNVDELPQMLNVLAGQMSVVGPRPALAAQTALLELRRARGVDCLRPGLTGLAQVNAYDGMPEPEKVEWEARYAARITFTRDLAILLRTVGYLMRRPPVY